MAHPPGAGRRAPSSATAIDRRGFLRLAGMAGLAGIGGSVLFTGGCGYYAPFVGAAYEPWSFPGTYTDPRLALVHAATLAASPHNTQPWLFRLTDGAVELHADMTRALGAMDPLRREMFVGLGCALENMAIAGRARGYAVDVRPPAIGADSTLVATVVLTPAATAADAATLALYDAIPRRVTNRGAYADLRLPAGLAAALVALNAVPTLHVGVVESTADRAAFAEGTVAATAAIIADEEMLLSSDRWYRHTKADIDEHRDGITIDAQTALNPTLRGLSKTFPRPDAKTSGDYWLKQTRDVQVGTVSAFVVLATPALNDPQQRLDAGRFHQRLHLWLIANGLDAQPVNQMAERRDRESQLQLSPDFGTRLAAYVPTGWHAQMLVRVGYGFDVGGKAPRRPVEWVLSAN